MSCDDITGSEVLVYVRRTNGGGVNGVIYSWDYYQMASLPTNDNVRYQMPKDKNPTIALHEIGNNRYEDMVCKSTHLAYKIGGFSRSAPIPIGEAKNQVDQRIETTDNRCVLLMVSSSNFYQRLPECWPWSCRRWTKEITAGKDTNGKKTKIEKYFSQDIDGNKIQVAGPPSINITMTSSSGQNFSKSYPVYVITKDTYGSDITGGIVPIAEAITSTMNGSVFYSVEIKKGDGNNPIDDQALLNTCNCEAGTKQIKIAVEIFPVLCNGTCKLVIKFGYLCYTTANGTPQGGRTAKKLISPFWSCRINESFDLYNEELDQRPIIGSVTVQLDGTDTAADESFNSNNPPTVITGQDYYHDTIDGKKIQIKWNGCDQNRSESYYPKKSGEVFGKASDYLGAGAECCKYCKSADQDGNITFTNNLYCSALDAECTGKSYAKYDDPCPTAGSGGSSDGGGGTTNGGIFTSVLAGGLGGGGSSAGGGAYSGGGGLTGGGSSTGGGLTGGTDTGGGTGGGGGIFTDF